MSDILDLIDGALRDYGTSTDAMRWTPEPGAADEHPIDAWLRATYGGVTSAEAMEASERIMADLTSGAVRGIVTAQPVATPTQGDLLADLSAAIALIERQPEREQIPARIEVDDVALAALRTLAVERTRPPWAGVIGDPFGIPIHINPDLRRGGWRALDRDGNVMHEGTVLPPGYCRIMCGDEVVYEGPIGSWPPVSPAHP